MLGSQLIKDIEQLSERISEFQNNDPTDLALEREELQVALEELHVAHEELLSQNLELEEARLRTEQQERRYRELFDYAPEAYFVTTAKGTILEANRQASRLTGVQSQRLARKLLSAYIPPADRLAFRAVLSRIGVVSGTHEWEGAIQPRHGRSIPVIFRVSVMRNPDGTVDQIRWMVQDISARKEVEERILRRQANLQANVEDRTIDLEKALGFKGEALQREQIGREMAQAAQYRLEFLAEASALLSSSLDYAETLQRVAKLAVPFLADWCVFDIVEDGGDMRRVAIAHEDPEMEALAQTFQEKYQPDPTRIKGIMRVLRTGQAELIPEVNDQMLQEVARDKTHLKALKATGARSVMIVPLVARNRALGVLTLATARSGRIYGQSHLQIAEDLARRAAQSVDNALLYKTVQEQLDERLAVEAELREHQAEIEALNERLKLAMMETHHRVKNNLQLISAMIDLRVMDETESVPTEDLVRLGKSVKTLASVHELLTAGARDGNSNLLPANAVLEQIIPMVKSSAPNREVTFAADEVLLSTRQGTSLALIANELASNALKYGKSRVGIQLRSLDGRAELEVCDDGPGFPKGFNAKKAANTGLDMVESLTKWDLSGKSTYENLPDGGARVVITFAPPSSS